MSLTLSTFRQMSKRERKIFSLYFKSFLWTNEKERERGPFQFAWATLVCSSFAGSNGVGGHLENQGKHAGGSQAIWDRFRPSRLLHSVTTLPLFTLLPKEICAHTYTHTQHHEKQTHDRAFGWLLERQRQRTFWHTHKYLQHFLFYLFISHCLHLYMIDTFLFHQRNVFHHFLPSNGFGISLYFASFLPFFESRFRPLLILLVSHFLISNLPQTCFLLQVISLLFELLSKPSQKCFSILPFTWRRWKTCGESVSACLLFQTNSKTNNVCVFYFFIFLFPSLSLFLSPSLTKRIYCLMSSFRTEKRYQVLPVGSEEQSWGIL